MKRIVIIGGGVGGVSLARELEKNSLHKETLLISPTDYLEIPFPLLREISNPSGLKYPVRKKIETQIPCDFLQGRVTSLKEGSLELEGGKVLDFDQAVVATGSSVRGFKELKINTYMTMDQRIEEINQLHRRLVEAKSVLIIGGGPIGVEMAGEIAFSHKGKKITLLQGPDRLLPALSHSVSMKTERVLFSMGVKVHCGTYYRVEETEHKADLVLNCLGNSLNNQFFGSGVSQYLNDKGQLKVEADLSVTGSETLWGIGDITDIDEIKLGAFLRFHSKICAHNIHLRLEGKGGFKKYKSMGSMGFVTLGEKKGIAQTPFFRFDPLIALKQKDMFSSVYLK